MEIRAKDIITATALGTLIVLVAVFIGAMHG